LRVPATICGGVENMGALPDLIVKLAPVLGYIYSGSKRAHSQRTQGGREPGGPKSAASRYGRHPTRCANGETDPSVRTLIAPGERPPMTTRRFRTVFALGAVLGLLAAMPLSAQAAAGDLDPSFGFGGQVTTDNG